MKKLKLPLTVDEQVAIADRASGREVPALLDLVVRMQNALVDIRASAHDTIRTVEDGRELARYIIGVIGQLMPER